MFCMPCLLLLIFLTKLSNIVVKIVLIFLWNSYSANRVILVHVNLQEVFYLTYTPEDVEGNVQLETGDKINFIIDTNKQ